MANFCELVRAPRCDSAGCGKPVTVRLSPHFGYATEISRYVVQYECAECAQLDRFEFGIYPCPVRVEAPEFGR